MVPMHRAEKRKAGKNGQAEWRREIFASREAAIKGEDESSQSLSLPVAKPISKRGSRSGSYWTSETVALTNDKNIEHCEA